MKTDRHVKQKASENFESKNTNEIIDKVRHHLQCVNLNEENFKDTVFSNETFLRINRELAVNWKSFLKLNPSDEIKHSVERYVNNLNESGFIYGKYAYREGFINCIQWIFSTNLLHDLEKETGSGLTDSDAVAN